MKTGHRTAAHDALRGDNANRVALMGEGEDVDRYGGTYAASRRLLEEPRHRTVGALVRRGQDRRCAGWAASHRRNRDGELHSSCAHIPGIKVVAPATVDNAYGMVMTALADDDPVIVFEHVALANSSADVTTLRATDIARAAIRRSGTDVALITYGESLPKTLGAAERRALAGVDCEFDASVARVCSAEVPVPYAKHLEQAALRQTAQIVTAATEPCGGPA